MSPETSALELRDATFAGQRRRQLAERFRQALDRELELFLEVELGRNFLHG